MTAVPCGRALPGECGKLLRLELCHGQWELFGGAGSCLARSPCSSVGRRLMWSPHPPCLAIGNVICENQWGGADIRHGGNPVLRNNLICCGYSDGVVVGERGKGLIEGNVIHGKDTSSGGEQFSPSPTSPHPLGLAGLPSASSALWSCSGCPGRGCDGCPGGGCGGCPGGLARNDTRPMAVQALQRSQNHRIEL